MEYKGDILAIGTYGLIYENKRKDYVDKVIPIYRDESVSTQIKAIKDEFYINKVLSDIKVDLHLYHRIDNTMRLTVDCPFVPCIRDGLIEIYQEGLGDKLAADIEKKNRRHRAMTDRAYIYTIEKVYNFFRDLVLPRNEMYVLISIYQLIEIYESLISLGINVGHHDLHVNNVSYNVSREGIYSTKIIDFGMSCYFDSHLEILSASGHDRDIPSLTSMQHAILDIVSIIMSCNQYIRSSFLLDLICIGDPPCLNSCRPGYSQEDFFNDFYTLGGKYSYRSIKICKIHETVRLDEIKQEIKNYLEKEYRVRWKGIDSDSISNSSSIIIV